MGGFELKAAKLRGCTAWACGLTTSFGEAGGRGSTKPIVISKRHSGAARWHMSTRCPEVGLFRPLHYQRKGLGFFCFKGPFS